MLVSRYRPAVVTGCGNQAAMITKTHLRRHVRTCAAVLLLLVLLPVLMALCARTIREEDLFYPRRTSKVPDDRFLTNVELMTPESVLVTGWYLHRPDDMGNLVYFYGNGETLQDSYYRLMWMMKEFRLSILAFDYRGYGASEGRPGVENLMNDALLIFEKRTDLLKNAHLPLIVYGRSIGTIPALRLAAEREIAGLILEAPISTASEVIREWRRQLPPVVRWLVWFRPERSLIERERQPIDYAGRVNCPLLVIHGAKDELIPLSSGRRVFEAAPSANKQFCIVEDAGHNNLDLAQQKTVAAIRAVLEGVFRDAARHEAP
jgi:pimeloyl-ACP methyl ester carboxylesterase